MRQFRPNPKRASLQGNEFSQTGGGQTLPKLGLGRFPLPVRILECASSPKRPHNETNFLGWGAKLPKIGHGRGLARRNPKTRQFTHKGPHEETSFSRRGIKTPEIGLGRAPPLVRQDANMRQFMQGATRGSEFSQTPCPAGPVYTVGGRPHEAASFSERGASSPDGGQAPETGIARPDKEKRTFLDRAPNIGEFPGCGANTPEHGLRRLPFRPNPKTRQLTIWKHIFPEGRAEGAQN